MLHLSYDGLTVQHCMQKITLYRLIGCLKISNNQVFGKNTLKFLMIKIRLSVIWKQHLGYISKLQRQVQRYSLRVIVDIDGHINGDSYRQFCSLYNSGVAIYDGRTFKILATNNLSSLITAPVILIMTLVIIQVIFQSVEL